MMIRSISFVFALSMLSQPLAVAQSRVAGSCADVAFQTYSDALTKAKALEAAAVRLITAPNHLAHIDARIAWIDARPPYLQSEVFRFPGSPADAVQALVNGRCDPAAIDAFIEGTEAITPESISTIAGGTGYHAIEYLLWGEDKAEDGPGHRSFNDYTSKAGNAIRRGQYLRSAAKLLVAQLEKISDGWNSGIKGQFHSLFIFADEKASLQRLFAGASGTATEIAESRISALLKSKRGEDESSPFSDTTHIDILHSTAGIANMLVGAYVGTDGKLKVQGKGPLALLEAASADQAKALKDALNKAMQAAKDVGKPIDQQILAAEDSPEYRKLTDCAAALTALNSEIQKMAVTLGVPLN